VVIQIQGNQRTDIELKYQFSGKAVGNHHRVQRMQTLYDNDRIFLQAKLMTCPFPFAALEIEGWDLHLMTLQKQLQMLPEQRRVNGIDMLQI